jgi:hypothetical protein
MKGKQEGQAVDRFAKARATKERNRQLRADVLTAIEPHIRAIQGAITPVTKYAVEERLCEVFGLDYPTEW